LYATFGIALVYALWYFDGKEYTGERRWQWFRMWRLWRYLSPVDYTITNNNELNAVHEVKRLYVMVPGDTVWATIWTIGLHGGQLDFADRLHYIVPPALMWIPVMRDVLMWTGAVTYHPKKKPLQDVLLDLLQANRSVCYCPSRYQDLIDSSSSTDGGTGIKTTGLSVAMFEMAHSRKMQLVPIVVHNERKRYYVMSSPTLARIQRFFFQWTDWPFPHIMFLRVVSRVRAPPRLQAQFGSIINCGAGYTTVHQIDEAFKTAVAGLTNQELGDDALHFN
jgi:hypothetical protein